MPAPALVAHLSTAELGQRYRAAHAILVAAHVLQALQTFVNRSVDVRDPLLISFGVVQGRKSVQRHR